MRDKVKRFLSILMTALMLVNLLPVGALAEGMKLDSNSVQSIGWWPWPEETWPDGSYKIYVYAKVLKGSVGGINVNKDGWYTLGYIDAQTMPSPIGTLGNLYGGGNAQGYDLGSLNAQSLIQSSAFHFEKNTNIPVRNTPIWSTDGAHGFMACSGATDYPETGNAPTWHLDILVNLKDVTPIHRLVFKVENSSGTQIGSKAIEGTWGQEITYEKGKDVPETITTKDGKIYELKRKNDNLGKTFKFDEVTKQIEFYYKYKGSVNHTLTINYVYEDGSEAAKSYQKTLPYQSYYSVTSPDITGYTADNPVVSGTMPADNVEVTVTYTKRTDLSYTVNYLEKVTNKVLHDQKVQGGMTYEDTITSANEKIDISGYNYDSVDPETLTIGTGENVINVYYTKRNDLSYTVNYYWNGTTEKVADSKTVNDQTFEAEVTEHPVEAEGYTPVSTDPKTITIDADSTKNVITFYYYKNVTLEANSATATYDGTPKSVSGYDCSVDGLTFEGITAGATGTLVGEYPATFNTNPEDPEFPKKQLDTTGNYIVAAVVPGLLTITDDPVDDANVITKKHGTEIDTDTAQSLYNLGDKVTFTVSVTNIYNEQKEVTLEEQPGVTFVDPQGAAIGTTATKTLEPGETWTIQATYTITSEDILEGVFHNTVTADFTGGGSWTAEDTVTTAELDTTLNVTKTSDVPDGQKAALGQTITYTIKVQNAGNVPYTNVKVEDPLTGLTSTIETLAVGETRTFTTEYVVTEADVLEGHVLNTATATGDEIKDPKSDEPKEPNGGDEVETPTFAPITIKPKDVTATYNGAAITGKDVEITSGKLLEGHKLSAAVIGSGVNAGSYELTLDPEKITIVDANNKDVSEMYARTILPGKLTIAKRSVLITSQSATKTYDGSALTRPAVTITGDGFVPGELAKAEATGSITKVGSTPNTIQYTTTGAFNAANYSIALSVGTLTVTEKPKPEPRRTFNLTINYVYQNGKRAAASYNRGGLKNGETFDITSPVIAGYTASETVVSGTIYNRDIKVTVIYTADGVNLDDYGVPLGLGNITMNVGDCFE